MTSTPGLLADRRAVVTGGAHGLGAAIVRRLAAAGATGLVLDAAAVEADTLPRGWSALRVDLSDAAAADACFARVRATLPRIDALVAVAGIVPPWASIADQDPDGWDQVFRVNVRGVLSSIQGALPCMGTGASVVVMASLNAWRGDPNQAAYVASKHAVLGLVRSAAQDLGRRGIRVNALAPGPIATEALLERMARREPELGISVDEALAAAAGATALGRIATADEVASAALFLASDLASGVTGQMLAVDGGIA